MTATSEKKVSASQSVSDKLALEHLQKIDKQLKGKNTGLIVLTIILLVSISANIAQFLNLL